MAPGFMTASGCGRDDLPATEGRLPSHSPSGSRAGRLRAIGQAEVDGRAADEAAARRKLRACPLADAKAAGFESAHGIQAAFGHVGDQFGTGGLRVEGTGQAGHRTFGSRTSPAESGTSVRAPPPGEKELRLRICRAGPGFGSGAAKRREPRASAHGTVRRNERLRPFDPAGRGTGGFGRRNRQGGKRDFGSKFAKRRTAGASAPSGSPRGNRKGLRLWMDPGGGSAGTSVPVRAPRNRPARMPRLPGLV
jgi:hypothetical protein